MTNRNRQPVTAAMAVAAAAPVAVASAETIENPAVVAEQPQDGAAAEAAEAAELVEGRVIIAFDHYEPNDIFVGAADDAHALEAEARIDCNPKAVAYAKSLAQG